MIYFVRHGRHDGAGGPIIDDFATLYDAEDFVLVLEEDGDEWVDPIEDDQA